MNSDIINNVEKDTLEIWQPLANLPDNMYIEAIYDDKKGMRIILSCNEIEDKLLVISVMDKISYRQIDDNILLDPWFSTDINYVIKGFNRVRNSTYVEFLNKMALDTNSDWIILHFLIATTVDFLDILCLREPVVEWHPRQDLLIDIPFCEESELDDLY